MVSRSLPVLAEISETLGYKYNVGVFNLGPGVPFWLVVWVECTAGAVFCVLKKPCHANACTPGVVVVVVLFFLIEKDGMNIRRSVLDLKKVFF